MKRLPIPAVDPGTVYAACVSGIDSQPLAQLFTQSTAEVLAFGSQYSDLASICQLHMMQPCGHGNESAEVLNGLTKGNLTSLYTDQMLNKKQAARRYYDKLLQAPLNKCPYCQFGHISTLDHFLSKSRYPLFSVLPANLVPACADCNKGKGAAVLLEGNQICHPYFEDSRIETDIWLYATIAQTTPVTASFFVYTPASWPQDLAQRTINYFTELNLCSRFAVEASSELVSLSDYLSRLEAMTEIRRHLQQQAFVEREHRRNSWKAALYDALSQSAWYEESRRYALT
jgi:hypothetical protein